MSPNIRKHVRLRKTQISLYIHAVWSVFYMLSAWRNFESLAMIQNAPSKDSDQAALM